VKTIGLLGGMSWESTAEYYRIVNETVRERLGGYHSAKVLLDSVDFAEIESLQTSGDWDGAADQLAAHALALQGAGADLVVLCTNTMHVVAERIEAVLAVPFLHIGDATAQTVRRAGVRTVGLLGTAFTMTMPFLSDRLTAHGLSVLVPEERDVEIVHRVIYDELVHGVVREASRDEYRAVIRRLVSRGAEGVILGCTEIELLIGADDSAVPVFATTRIHAEAAVEVALR
jgi:aspartate racemase